MEQNKIAIFEQKEIRKIIHDDEWYFSVVDIIEVLSGSPRPRQYWGKIKDREFVKLQLSPIWVQLKMKSNDNKMRLTDCINTKNAFRLIQSIPSKKAEPFKMWLAEVGKQRIEEIENPELSMDRMKELYEKKGYSKDWIDKRTRGIAVRQDLTDEWRNRGIEKGKEYSILTAEISKATFGMTPSEYKYFKGLKNENLRDHMTDLELIFNMLGEASTTRIIKNKNSEGFKECKIASRQGGKIAGNARIELEEKSNEKIISEKNYLEGGNNILDK